MADQQKTSPQPAKPASRTAFISGHLDITTAQFLEHYQSRLDAAITANDSFILSTARGADTFALEYLLENGVEPSRITVYIASRSKDFGRDSVVDAREFTERGLGVEVVEGGHGERDERMTEVSDYDVLWVRPEKETRVLYGERWRSGRISGTERNRERRERKDKEVRG